jgi:succinate dehydrogenase / fumarate reductase, cytochrome b subunit
VLPPSKEIRAAMSNRPRPLSPHLQVYRWQITMVMSILFRATGIVLSVGAFVIAWWLLAVAAGGDAYAGASALLSSPIGMLALFVFSLAMVYHLLNGFRHLLWDAGWGLDIPEVYKSGWTVAVLTVVLTALIWVVALGAGA